MRSPFAACRNSILKGIIAVPSRLPGYDYSSAGLYYVTICIQDRACLLGEVRDGVMIRNDAGDMVQEQWLAIADRFSNVAMDEFIIMPNHLHGILEILDPEHFPRECDAQGKNVALGGMLGAFKSEATNAYINGVKMAGWKPFNRKLFQRNYWEHIIRDSEAYQKICLYMAENPQNWNNDSLRP